MELQPISNSGLRRIRRKPVPSLPSPISEEADPIDTAYEPLLHTQDEDVSVSTELSNSRGRHEKGARLGDKTVQESDTSSLKSIPKTDWRPVSLRLEEKQIPWTIPAEKIFNGWWLEIFCCWLSIASLGALVVLLYGFNDQPLPDWPSGITVNTAVAFISTVARTAFTVPVAEGLSQCKWNWFKKKPRQLRDFDLFDSASRGPWGSMSLLIRTKGWGVGILSAILLVSAVATSTLTQSAISYPERNITDVTDLLKVAKNEDSTTSITLPNGVNMTVNATERVIVESREPISDYNPDIFLSSIFNYSVIHWDAGKPPRAADVVMHWCVNTYDAKMENNKLQTPQILSHTQCQRSTGGVYADAIELSSPAENVMDYIVGGVSRLRITGVLREAITGESARDPIKRITTGSDRLLHAMAEIKFEYDGRVEEDRPTEQELQDIWWDAIDRMARNIETGLINFLLVDGGVIVEGTAWTKQTYIKVRWEWLTFLAVQVCLSIIILVMIIWETAVADVDIIKSSTLPALFAINSEELASIEHRFEEGEPLVEKGHQQVVPHGIGGQLHKTGGKWILRSR
ncbi:hypothetical protein CGCSCA4_v006524 [Colletotrichum siamense]|uniref:Uncharacterized protein n=1 Tax=Colletotrichum siamense TaxID=690259 RepID=A0A9P5BPJ1_COLSI|nr:hypothetical protein CGCSCA4_v006524 [Colletotrichum siamense]KAF4847642.1 hypothetical protein CGCSCA2_v012591 [Colletotrichum siamense]